MRATMKSLDEIFKRCEKTGAWCGETINSVHQRNDMSDTVLHTVCSWGDLDSTAAVLAAGADVNSKGDQGATPLFNAVIGRSPEVVRLLILAGCDRSMRNDYGRLAAEYARNVGAPMDIVKVLEAVPGIRKK